MTSGFIKVACPHCGGHVEFDLQNEGQTIDCPHCNAAILLAAPAPQPKRSPPLPRATIPLRPHIPLRKTPVSSNAKGFLVIAIAVVVIVFYGIFSGPENVTPEQAENELGLKAWYGGRAFVEKNLKAPSTAKFPRPRLDPDCFWSLNREGNWQVGGYVDSQNAFGAMIRSEWMVVVRPEGDAWRGLFLKLGDTRIGDPKRWLNEDKAQ